MLRCVKLAAPIQLVVSGYLFDKKWHTSFYRKAAVGSFGEPIPWLSYPFIHFLEDKIKSDFDIFEYGSGNSTIWFAKRANTIISVEHDKAWADGMLGKLPHNAQLEYRALSYDGAYAQTIRDFDKQFDVVVIDGRDRVNCAKYALSYLKETGVIIFDNTDRKAYRPAFDFLAKKGFKNIAFEGMSPGTHVTGCTTIFYRPTNCFNI